MKSILTADRDRLWVYVALPIVLLFLAGSLGYGIYFALCTVRPEMVAILPAGQVTFGLYLLIAVVEWSLAISIVVKLRRAALSAMNLIAPHGDPWRFRWLPAGLVFVGLNTIMAVFMLMLVGLPWAPLGFSYYQGLHLWQRVLMLIVIPVSAGFCEELIWRGYVITRLEARGRGRWVTVLLAAIFFTLIHSPFHWVFTFLFGILAGYYYTQQRNLIPLMTAHAFVNLWSFGWFLILR